MKALHFSFFLVFCFINLLLPAGLRAEKFLVTQSPSPKQEVRLTKRIFNLSEPNKFFAGRKEEIDKIIEALFKTNQHILVIEGVSGIGKTQLAKKYAYSFLDKYDLVWWFDGEKNIGLQIDKLLKEIFLRKHQPYYQPSTPIALMKKLGEELSAMESSWLIIFDNMEDTSLINECIPFKNSDFISKHVIITSKKMNKMHPSIIISKFKREESLDFLSKSLETGTREDFNKLAETLEDFPLALAQAASYIKMNPSINIETYVQLFKESYSELWKSEEKLFEGKKTNSSLADNYNKTISTAIKINIDSIRTSSPLAYEILSFCSLLNHQHIPLEVLERWACHKHGATKLEFHEALSILLNFFLLEEEKNQQEKQGSKLFNQHELIQLIALETIGQSIKETLLKEAAECILQELTATPETLFEQFRGREYFYNHIDKLCNLAKMLNCNSKSLKELKIAQLYFIHFFQRDFDRSSKFIKVLEGLVKNDKDLNPLAQLWFYCVFGNDQIFENFLLAQQIYQKGLKCLEKIQELETQNSYRLQLNTNYIESLSNFGKIKEAISLCDRLEETLKTTNNKSEKIAFLGVSAMTRLKYGQYDQTLKDINYCLELIAKEKGDEKFVPLLMLAKAHCLLYQAQPQKAYEIVETYYPHLLEIFTSPDCMVVVKSRFVKGACLASFGKLDEAQHIVEQSLESYEKSTGFENDSLKGMGYRILGEIFEAKGNLTKAYEKYNKAEVLYEKILQGKNLDDISRLYTQLAILGAKQGDDVMVKKYLSLHIENFGLAHPRTFEIKKYLESQNLSLP